MPEKGIRDEGLSLSRRSDIAIKQALFHHKPKKICSFSLDKSMFKISSFGLKWRLLPLDYGFFSANSAAIPLEKPFVQNQNPSI